MKTRLECMLTMGIVLLAVLISGCSKDVAETISITSSSDVKTPFKVKTMYFCDHTNHQGRDHIHPGDCGARNCPRLNPDGTFSSKEGTYTGCPDESNGGMGIKLALASLTNSASTLLNSLKSKASTALSAGAREKVETNGSVSGKLSANAQGTLAAGIGRGLQASFSKKWDEIAHTQFQTNLNAQKSQFLALASTVGGYMGCGQKNSVGIDFDIIITITVTASATVEGTADDDGTWKQKDIQWINFNLDVSFGLVGKGLVPKRDMTTCNCSPREKTEPADDGNDGNRRTRTIPRRQLVPPTKEKKGAFGTKRTILVQSDNLESFQTERARVFVLDETKNAAGQVEKIAVLVPSAGAGGYMIYEIVTDGSQAGSHAATGLDTLKSTDRDTIAYEAPESPDGTHEIGGMDHDGNPLRRETHNLGSINGRDIIVLDNRDRAFGQVDSLTCEGTEYELSTVSTELTVHPRQKVGSILGGILRINASPTAAENYRFDIILHAPGFQPMTIHVKDVRANFPFALEQLNLVATKTGSNDVSVEILPVKK